MEPIEASPRVRGATAADLAEVFDLAAAMALTFAPEPGAFRTTYAAVLDDPGAHLLVVDAGGGVGGYLLGFTHRAFFANGLVAWVEEIAVHADLRRRSLGRRLMTAFEDEVRDRGGRLVALATTRAGPFYAALGYDDHAVYHRKLLADPGP